MRGINNKILLSNFEFHEVHHLVLPDRKLTILATLTHSRQGYTSLFQSLDYISAQYGNQPYPLGFIEGHNYETQDATALKQKYSPQHIIDPFLDPLSSQAFRLLKTRLDDVSTVDAASRFVSGWLAYAQNHNEDMIAMDVGFRKVLAPYFPKNDYLVYIEPSLGREKAKGATSYTNYSISNFEFLMRAVNEQTSIAMREILEKTGKDVLVYCGKNHVRAVYDAVMIQE